MITQMSKVEILVLKEDIDKAIGALHGLGLLHIEQSPLTKIMEQRGILRLSLNSEEEKEKALCEELVREVNEVIDTFRGLIGSCRYGVESAKEVLKDKSIFELDEVLRSKIKPQFSSLNREITTLKDEQKILPQYKEILESFSISKRELKIHEDMSCIALIFDRRYEKDMDIFKTHMEEKTKTTLEVYTEYLNSKKMVALVFYKKDIGKQIDEEIFKKGTMKIELPIKYLNKPLDEIIRSIDGRLAEIAVLLEEVNKKIDNFVKENISVICSIKTLALNRLEEIQILNNLLQSKYTSVITGWIPKKDLSRLEGELEKSLNRNFAIYDRTSSVKNRDEIPVLLENPKVIRPYELLLSFLPLPKYGTRDATGLISIFFPLFFGLMVGDIGYGLVFLTISLFLKRSGKDIIRSIGSLLFNVSVSCIFFGILFGEFLGNLGKHYLKLPHILFDRHESIIPFLILAVSIGVFHIVLGFILGIIEAFRKRHRKEIIEKFSILGGLLGMFLLVGVVVEVLPGGFLPPSIVILVVITVLLIIVKGFIGPLEAISTVANILSYARLMALGVAGIMMANIANHIGGLPENIFIGIILASLLHALNLVLSVFSPTIQSLRLHYVEFFSKFYEPGGKKYIPFRKKEVAECLL